ncbi:MAG: bifunctional (p)ppGpp synthetase/guanosine-3',5'-bis(diphosphate) 3'-pyrophosphohydrolase [Pseudomonadota bacterium]|nr:bifunctional (p)ppGpp synthetase/guanosine-3',5'-bis(diphosphate) 3'-pyrophosphohydrolase [Pseudomonadota bacterium]
MVKPVYNLPEDHFDDAAAARHWLAALPEKYPDEDRERLTEACELLVRCRGNQTLETGETQVRHLLSTADILVRLRMDVETLFAALLNGCLDRSGITRDTLQERFGTHIASMVEDLARIDQIANVDAVIAAKDRHEHEENLRRLLLGIAEDVRVVLVVLAERVHLMRSIKNLDVERRRKIAVDSQRVYAPLANRLGVWQIKWELEDLCLRYLEPAEYKRIAKLLDGRRGEREGYIANVIKILQEKFKEADIKAAVSGRPKHIYSIWRKMQRKNVDIEQIFDLRAVRVMVDDIASCYAALGIVHGLWKHIPKEFDDYIATPKGNMYQSLHTAVVGPQDKPLEVQIRTWDMHRHAEFGVAAHWAYKESKAHDAEFQRRVVWMRNWLELKNEGEDGGDFVERFKAEFEPVHIYVLTPQSKVIELPKGATPLDFAYAIHSEIGNRCRGARVNGRIVPLNQPLASGQSVEILTQKNAAPSRDWLSPHHGYLKTAKARNRVRQWFKQQDFDRYLAEGRSILEKELARLGIEEKPQLEQIGRRYNFHKGEDVLAAIGRGELAPGQIARQVGEPKTEKRDQPEPKTKTPSTQKRKPAGRAEVVVEGVDDLMSHMAHCCKPVPYDPIVGYVTRGRGVTVHRRDCTTVRKMPPEEQTRLIDVHWAQQREDATYPVDVLVMAADRKGLLRDVSSVFSDEDVDVVGVNTSSDRNIDRATMRFTVEVKDMGQLEHVLIKLVQIPDVIDVRRTH